MSLGTGKKDSSNSNADALSRRPEAPGAIGVSAALRTQFDIGALRLAQEQDPHLLFALNTPTYQTDWMAAVPS